MQIGGEYGLKFKLFHKKTVFIVCVCLLIIAVIVLAFITLNRSVNIETKKSYTKPVSVGEVRKINFYTVDSGQRELIKKYAEEYWDFEYFIDFHDIGLDYSTKDITEIIMDKLINEPDSIDLYCVPAYATQFVKGELSEYACTFKELGIDVKKALKKADIPQYIIDNGSNPEGELITLPYNATVSLFVYRRSVAKEIFGTDDPDEINKIIGGGTNSWDRFIEAAKTLKENGYYIVSGYMDLAVAVDNSFSLTDNGEINPAWIEYMDVAKYLYDKGYIKDTRIWTQNWYDALDDKGDKVFGYITFTDNFINMTLENTAEDWAACMAPYNIIYNFNLGIMVNKNSPNKDILGPFIEWLTLDSSKAGYQYRAASEGYQRNRYTSNDKISVILGRVLKKANGSRKFFEGQNLNPLIYEILKNPYNKSYSYYSNYDEDFLSWQDDVVGPYVVEGKPKDEVIKNFMSRLAMQKPEEDKVIVWKSKNFENVIRKILLKPTSDIYLSDLYKITSLNLDYRDIESLEDIVHFKNLKWLSCQSNQISDISYLKELPDLQALYLNNNKIKEIDSLKELKKLKELSLWSNDISDISPLSGLTEIKTLYLGSNKIKDISSLEKMINLEYLDLSYNDISDISGLKGLKKLTYLMLNDNKISDISPLTGLKALKNLNLDNNSISDLSGIEDLINLESLHMSNNNISDVTKLAGLTNLMYLYLNDNKIQDIGVLSNLKNLRSLEVRNNKIKDISNLRGLPHLGSLDMSGNIRNVGDNSIEVIDEEIIIEDTAE